eukprot:gene12543-13829_t
MTSSGKGKIHTLHMIDVSIFLPPNRKCDKTDCNSMYPTWRVFNCGHSFHTPCLLPSLSTCFLCKEMLSEKLKQLSEKINASVFDTAFQEAKDDASDDDSDVDNNDDEDMPSDFDDGDVEGGEMMDDEAGRALRVDTLIYKIANWKRNVPTMH